MLMWWFIGSLGYLLIARIASQGNPPPLADLDSRHDPTTPVVDPSANDGSIHAAGNETHHHHHQQHSANGGPSDTVDSTTSPLVSSTTLITQVPEPFSCYQCVNCSTKADLVPKACGEGVTMCFKVQKRIDNTTRLVHRGCSTSKLHCIVPHDEESNPFGSITCCNSHKCNVGATVKPLHFLFKLGLFILLLLSLYV